MSLRMFTAPVFLVVAALMPVAGCAFNEDGRLLFCPTSDDPRCEGAPGTGTGGGGGGGSGGSGGSGGGGTGPTAPAFVFDRALMSPDTVRLPVGGVMRARVESPASTTITATEDFLAFEALEVAPFAETIEVIGIQAGQGIVMATPSNSTPFALPVEVTPLATIVAAHPFGEPQESFEPAASIELRLLDAKGDVLLDHSLAIDPASDPGFVQTRWDMVNAPSTPGDYVLALRRDTGDVHQVAIQIRDQ